MEYSIQYVLYHVQYKKKEKIQKFKNGNTINSLWKTELSGDRRLRLKDGAQMTIQMW